MIERIAKTYQQINRWVTQIARVPRFVSLHVVPLEERATPAVVNVVPALPQVEFVAIVPAAPVPAPAVVAAPLAVRTDLFGSGYAGKQQPDVFEEWFADPQTPRENLVSAPSELAVDVAAAMPEMDGDANVVHAVFSAEAAGEN